MYRKYINIVEAVSVFISSGGALTRTAVGLTWLVD